jgi:hypothetical protein
MGDALWLVAALLGLAALLYKLRALLRDPKSLSLRLICTMLACMAVTATLGPQQYYVAFDRMVGIANLSALVMNACGMGFVLAVQRLLLVWAYPNEQAPRRSRWWFSLYLLALIAQVVLFALAPVDVEDSFFIGRYAATPFAREFIILIDVCLIITLIDIARLCRRYASVAGRQFLRVGLRCTGIGAICSLFYFPVEVLFVLTRSAGVTFISDDLVLVLYTVLGINSTALITAGLTIPAWGPRLAAATTWVGRYRAYRRLHPLWLALYQASPHIALDVPATGKDPLWINDLDYRLVRRVVEIHDGRLALRPYLSAATARDARRRGEQTGLAGTALQAAVEAAVITDAIRAKNHQVEPADRYPLDATGAADLASETAWLGLVARALTRLGTGPDRDTVPTVRPRLEIQT